METEVVAPGVELLESMRSVGYSLEAALADLVDNSISAGASVIDIDVDVVDATYIAVLDDGSGMSPDLAREALRLAGDTGSRGELDLGRFGLGLKTASLSQCRSLSVSSKQRDATVGFRWDIDHVRRSRRWELIRLSVDELSRLPLSDRLRATGTGTLVVWENLDLLLGDTTKPGEFLAARLEGVREHLALVFHRFLAGPRSKLQIVVNGVRLLPLDPFLEANPHTQTSPTELVAVGGEQVEVTAFTLPHPSNLTSAERNRADLSERMRENQGLYIYRNGRLISHGHWYGLARLGELSKQTRVRVDVPVSLDNLWQLDIKKSRAEPPASFKAHLSRILSPVVERGKRIHKFRGRKQTRSEFSYVWEKVQDRNGFRYEINRDHPVVRSVRAQLDGESLAQVDDLLRLFEASFPFLDAYQEMAANSQLAVSTRDSETLVEQLRLIRRSGVLGDAVEKVTAVLRTCEPFASAEGLQELVRSVWEEGQDA